MRAVGGLSEPFGVVGSASGPVNALVTTSMRAWWGGLGDRQGRPVPEALIVRGAPAWPEPVARLGRVVPLRSPDGAPLGLLPLTGAVRSLLGDDGAATPVPGFLELRQPVVELAAEASLTPPVAYVHAEFFGGGGFQAAVGWRGGKVAFGPPLYRRPPRRAPAPALPRGPQPAAVGCADGDGDRRGAPVPWRRGRRK